MWELVLILQITITEIPRIYLVHVRSLIIIALITIQKRNQSLRLQVFLFRHRVKLAMNHQPSYALYMHVPRQLAGKIWFKMRELYKSKIDYYKNQTSAFKQNYNN